MLSKTLNRSLTRRKNDDGFTLIELLVVVVILGILIGIAIPVYLNYRKSANDKAAQSDLRNAVAALEVCNSDNGVYPTAVSASGALTPNTGTTACSQKITLSSNTTLNYFISGQAYIMTSTNSGGTPKVYCYSSAAGGSVKESAAITAYAATCPAAP